MRIYTTLLTLIMLLLVTNFAYSYSTINCSIDTAAGCSWDQVIRVTSAQSAHASTNTDPNSVICCETPVAPTIASHINPAPITGEMTYLFSLQNATNSHVTTNPGKFSNDYDLYIEDTSTGEVVCEAVSHLGEPLWDCVAEVDEATGHLSQCGAFGTFDTPIYCKLLYGINVTGGPVYEETRFGGIRESENAIVELRYRNHTLHNFTRTQSDGTYHLSGDSVAYGTNLSLHVKKPGYIAHTFGPFTIMADGSIPDANITLELGSVCQADCTRKGSEFCDPTCVGINGCGYDTSFTTMLYGQPADVMDVCNMQKKGWVKDFNSTHVVQCCNSTPYVKSGPVGKAIKIDANVSDVQSYEVRTVVRKGKLVTLHVSMWNELE